ncbi:MAG TPA: TerC/Alx family metal homeostasis membrane protein [Acidimicrobiales bacterium]|nr:TerC/Alx family metal homeostasis membrane protein [Acidimicrobiales bacterium]
MTEVPVWAWCAVVGAIAVLLVIDIRTYRLRPPTLGWALLASAGWILVSVVFGLILGLVQGSDVASQYFAAYLLEKALSVDNVFVFVVLFGVFAVPREYQHRVLYYGVVGALVLRAAFIAAGANLLDTFSWVLYIFGAIVIVGGIRMARSGEAADPDRNLLVRATRRVIPVTRDFQGDRFFVRDQGRLWATPLFIALVAIESSDLVFATDSIPAVFGVTRDVFVVFTSNAFAVLGLRALYFVLADIMDRFAYLKYGLSLILIFIGIKLMLTNVVELPIYVSLVVIAVVITASVLLSLLMARRRGRPPA